MMQRLCLLIILMLLIIPTASAGVSDLTIEINPQSFNNLSAGDVGEFEVIITNNGPDEAGLDSPVGFPISINTGILFGDGTSNVGFSRNLDISQDCIFLLTVTEPRPPDPIGVVYSFYHDRIPANSSISCFARFQVFSDNVADTVEWRVINPSDTDPDETNNRVNMNFFGSPVSVPTLSLAGLLILIGLMLVAIKVNQLVASENQ